MRYFSGLILIAALISSCGPGVATNGTGGGVSAPFGKAIKFTSPGQSISLFYSTPTMIGVSSSTVEAWIRVDGPMTTGMGVIYQHSSSTMQPTLYVSSNLNLVASVPNTSCSSPNLITSSMTLQQGQKYHVVLAASGSAASIFVNGVFAGTGPTTNAATCSSGTGIIGNDVSGLNWFNGVIDEVRLTEFTQRYSPNFIIPRSPFSPDANSSFIFHTDNGVSVVPGSSVLYNIDSSLVFATMTGQIQFNNKPQIIDSPFP